MNIHKFIKKRKNNLKKCDMSTEIIINEIEIKDNINDKTDSDIYIDKVKKIKKGVITTNKIIKDNKDNIIIKDNKDILNKGDIKDNLNKGDIKDSIIKDNIINNKDKDNIIIKDNNINKDNIINNKAKDNNIFNNISLRDKVLNFTNINKNNIKISSLDKHLNLPKKYLNITKIFRVMLTIQKYNLNRGLSNIFIKCKKCIEEVLKFRINNEDINIIKNILEDKIIIKDIEIEEVKTFTYFINCSIEEFEERIWEYIRISKENNICNYNDKKEENIPNNDKKNNNLFNYEDKNDNTLNIIKEEHDKKKEDENNDKKNYNNKYNNILDRIKEKEKLRKEEFIRKSKEEDNSIFLKKLNMFFKKENKTCIKIKEIIKVFNLFDGERYMKKVFEKEKLYEIREISGEEYLIKKI